MFAHRLPIFANRNHPIVVLDTDMVFMTDPAGLIAEFPSMKDNWLYKMPLSSGELSYELSGPSAMCSCVVIQNLRVRVCSH